MPPKGGSSTPYQPRMTDPASGAKMRKGSPVDNAGPSKPTNYAKMKTVQSGVQRVGPMKAFQNPDIRPGDQGRAVDPTSGSPMRKGAPVPTAYSGGMADKGGQAVSSALGALKMSFQPPGSTPAPKPFPMPGGPAGGKTTLPGDTQPEPASQTPSLTRTQLGQGKSQGPQFYRRLAGADTSPTQQPNVSARRALQTRGGARGQRPPASPLPSGGGRAAPITSDLDKVAAGKTNTPGYEDFPSIPKTKPPSYPY